MRELRIHHFFDIIRDYGAGKDLEPHPYGHSYRLIAREIYENRLERVKLVVRKCSDSIVHSSDFTAKEAFNDFLDRRIMKNMAYEHGQIVELKDLIRNAGKYLETIYDIYEGNNIAHTSLRREHVSAGIEKKKNEYEKL